MINDILHAALRSLAAFILVLFVTRVLGRKAISQMTFFDFAVAITIGSVTASLAIGQNNTFHTVAVVLLSFCILGLVDDYLHIKSFRFNKLINSEPLIVIKDGKIVEKNMRRERITISELTALLRIKNVVNISDVNYAILENSGKLSVLLKAKKRPLIPDDMQINPPESGLTRDVIMNGDMISENLRTTNFSETWVMEQLKASGVNNIKEVFYAALASDGSLYISKIHHDDQENHGQHGIE